MYPIERTVTSKNCGSKLCKVCINMKETSPFTSPVTRETSIINQKSDCNAGCLVYLLRCHIYKIQYVDQINFAQDGLTAKVISENISEVVHACNNICLTIFVPLGILGFYTMSL